MKICEKCKTAQFIKGSKYVERGGKFGKTLIYVCRNPKCTEYNKEQEIFQEIKVIKED